MSTPMYNTRRFIFTLALVACGALLALMLGAGSPALASMGPGSQASKLAAPQVTGTPCGQSEGWNVVPAPDGGSYSNTLYSVTSVSPSDAWAVGEQYSSNLSSYIAMIEHWDGTTWSVVQGSPYGLNLRGVAAISTNDVWAVGWMGGYGFSPFTEHWDGTQWTYIPANVSGGGKLYAVSAVSSTNVWAVGQSTNGVLIFHWNGSQWLASATPSIPTGVLNGVTTISANDVWAVGTANNAETVTLHWDGTQWSRIASPNSGSFINVLTAVTSISSNNIWAVGYWATSGVDYHGYTLHWDGTQWNANPNPTGIDNPAKHPEDPTPAGTYLYGVLAATNGEVWAVGRNLQTAGTTVVTIRLHGGNWSMVPSPNLGYANTNLYGVSVSGTSGAWAVGNYDTNSSGYTVPSPQQFTPSNCPTETPGTPTSTYTSVPTSAPTNTVVHTSTPTPCGNGMGWNRVPAPDSGSYSNGLYGVASLSANDAWAVGEQYDSGLSSYMGMIEHWDGTGWSVIPSSRYGISVRGVAAISSNDVWAVGWMGGYGFSPFTEHWDGSQWTYVPANASGGRKLYAVSGVSSTDVWAVGQSTNGVLIFHWDGSQWTPSSAPSVASGVLNGVTAISANDVWAVGTSNNAQTVTLHWDGTQWSRIASPNSGEFINVLTAVSASASDNVWATGYWATSGVDYHGYSLHWDGSQWVSIINPTSGDNPIATGTYLYGVSTTPDGNVWMVGRNLQNNGSTGVAMRFDGDSWTLTPSPNPGYANTDLYAVTATTDPNNVLAVGNYDDTSYGYTYPLIEHYSGPCATPTLPPATITATPTACTSGPRYLVTRSTGATIVPGTDSVGIDCQFNCTATIALPFPFTLYDRTFKTAIVGSNGVLGFVSNASSMQPSCLPSSDFNYAIAGDWETLVYRYSGEGSSGGKDQPGTNGAGVFTSVTGEAPNRIFNIEWRARDQFNVSPVNFEIRLYENREVGRFDIVYAAVNHHGGHASVGVQMDTGSRWTQFSCLTQGRIEHDVQLTFVRDECGTQSTPTAEATTVSSPVPTDTAVSVSTDTPVAPTSTHAVPTNTQAAATSTIVVPTGTTTVEATSTPGECHITFSDVAPDSTFYAQINCLACRGVMSGYGDGTFRPDTEITRGQLSKIVANSAGFEESVTDVTFEDVPVGSTFYDYVERMVSRGVISGYACGGIGEPCGPENKPYFRPFATATRGQIAKIVSNAVGYNDIPGRQMFEDVPASSTFYMYIERLGSRSIMGGYPCGGPGEQCGDGNLPYFRLYNNATRGQTAKIVANTFLPDCASR